MGSKGFDGFQVDHLLSCALGELTMNTQTQPKAYLTFCQKAKSIPFAEIAQSLHKQGWKNSKIQRAMIQYLHLLFLVKLYPNETIVPDQETDEVLHTHLKFKQQFQADCFSLLGGFLVHESGFDQNNQLARSNWECAVDRTQKLMKQHFGTAAVSNFSPAYCVLKMTNNLVSARL